MSDKTYNELVLEVQALCEKIKDDPQARYDVREAFYERYGYVEQDGKNYGRSELAFLEWEIKRGVLNPMDDSTQPGSRWWRNVNLNFIFMSELAGAMKNNDVVNPDAPMPTLKWLDYINDPTPETWYIAHNSSILDGFKRYEGCTTLENKVEVVFINITLYRLLFAQAMVEEVTIFPQIAEEIADPRGIGVTLLTHLPDFYPPHYPLTPQDLSIIQGRDDTVQDKMVWALDTIILANLKPLYQAAAVWDDSPFVMDFITTKKIPIVGISFSEPTYGKDAKPVCSDVIGVLPS